MPDHKYLELSPAHRAQFDRIVAAGGIRGGDGESDPPADPAAGLQAALDTPPADPAPAPDPAPTGPAGDPPADADSFPRAYVERLRRESAGYRERASQYGVLEQLDDAQRAGFLQMAEAFASNDPAAIRHVAEAFGFELPPDDTPEYLTADTLHETLDEREQRAEQARATEEGRTAIQEAAKGYGFEPGTRKYRHLLETAHGEFSEDEYGNPRSPVEAVNLAARAMIDEIAQHDAGTRAAYLAGKEGGVVPVTNGDPTGNEKVPTNLEESSAAFREWAGNMS